MRKSTKLAILVAALVALCSFASFAAGWVLENGEYYYTDKDGNYVYGEWKKDGGSYYYLDDATGAMLRDQLIDGEKSYYVDGTGARVINQWVKVAMDESEDGFEWMYFGSTGAAYKDKVNKICPVASGEKFKFSFDSNGYMAYGYCELIESEAGSSVSMVDNIVGADYYYGDHEDGALKTSYWVEVTDGTATGHEEDESVWFYFGSNGKQVRKTADGNTAKYQGKTYSFAEDGAMLDGWSSATPASAGYYDGGVQAKKAWEYTNKFSDDEDDYYWYWIDGDKNVTMKGIYKIPKDGKYYAFDAEGRMFSGLVAMKNADPIDPKATQGDVDFIQPGDTVDNVDLNTFAKFSKAVNAAGYQLYFFSNDGVADGSMKTGTQTVEAFDDTLTLVFDKYGVALNGYKKIYNYGELQSAGSSRLAVKYLAVSDDTEITEGYYLVNAAGALLKNYKGTDSDGIFWVVTEYQKNFKFADKDFASQAATAVKEGKVDGDTFSVRVDGKYVDYTLDITDSGKGYSNVNWTK